MRKSHCPFCGSESAALFPEPGREWQQISSRIVERSGTVALCAGLGAIAKPYLLAFPADHYLAVTELSSPVRKNLLDALDRSLAKNIFPSGTLAVFEHGGANPSHGVSPCLEHCHLHIVDGRYDLRPTLRAEFRDEAEPVELSDTNGFAAAPGYLFAGIYHGDRRIVGLRVNQHSCGSQMLRQRLAALVGTAEWDWRLHPNPDCATSLCNQWREIQPSVD